MRPALVALAALLLLAGCGGGSHARRDAVNAYFDRVEAAQLPVRRQATAISKAFGSFSTVKNSPKEQAALVHAHTVLAGVERRVSAVEPPVDAKRMHRDIVRLYSMQAAVAAELVQMSRFVPRYKQALVPLVPTHARLATELKTAKGWKPVAAAFRTYRLSLASVLAKLDGLAPPPTLEPSFAGQRAGIRRSIGLCASIEDALARHDQKATAAAIGRLATAAAEKTAVKAHNAQVAAASAYNARLAAISALQRKIGSERERLVRTLG
jgi:hypothetical protein